MTMTIQVTVVETKDIIGILSQAQREPSHVRKNFFANLATAGCLLDCQVKQDLNQVFLDISEERIADSRVERQRAKSTWIQHIKGSAALRKEWFEAGEMATSAARGCMSCATICQILQCLFSGNQHELSDQHLYSVSDRFEVRRRPLAQPDSVEVIQLFQPPGTSTCAGRMSSKSEQVCRCSSNTFRCRIFCLVGSFHSSDYVVGLTSVGACTLNVRR